MVMPWVCKMETLSKSKLWTHTQKNVWWWKRVFSSKNEFLKAESVEWIEKEISWEDRTWRVPYFTFDVCNCFHHFSCVYGCFIFIVTSIFFEKKSEKKIQQIFVSYISWARQFLQIIELTMVWWSSINNTWWQTSS